MPPLPPRRCLGSRACRGSRHLVIRKFELACLANGSTPRPAHAQNNLAMMVVASTGRGVVRAWQWQTSRGVAVLAATRRLLSSPVTPDFNTSVNVAEHSISLRKARAKRAATIDELKVSFVCTRVARQAVRGWVDLLT